MPRLLSVGLCSLALSIAGCMGGPEAPSELAVIAAVTEALARQDVAARLIDQEIGLATDWRLDAVERVSLIGEPQTDGPNGAWSVRVSLRGTWSGAMPEVPAQRPARPTVPAQPPAGMQPQSEPPPWVAKQVAEGQRNAQSGSPATDPRVPKDWVAGARPTNTAPSPTVTTAAAVRKKQVRTFERSVTVRLVVDSSGSLQIP